eukprot:CAMPEP_0172481842 /NCGR_PEP_ID=MMETSP1066-20121228/7994_1 /TAXON_ID=671091 /ORGANISM="Coscinodiscus wailesii, Strain CCMP2513" /LENGTH=262 /DNA_ID=CAMNT_0013244509 /DNA_START=56 /DNA_END=844 /DNA_ORIENTATION=-
MTVSSTTQTMKRLLILGGNGYVGQNICHAALSTGQFLVSSLSRSGAPSAKTVVPALRDRVKDVEWHAGVDLSNDTDDERRKHLLRDADVVISTVGAFGSNEFMERVCGDATVHAIETAADGGGGGGGSNVSCFGFVSSAQVGHVDLNNRYLPLKGYFKGKSKVEEALRRYFPTRHVILRPGFIYGDRPSPMGVLPLGMIGAPADFVSRRLGPISSVIQSVPFVGRECKSMVSVESVSRAMVESVLEEEGSAKILDADDIRKF